MKKCIALFILYLFCTCAYSHPHMWFTSEFEFQFQHNELYGLTIVWKFDRFFSSDIINGYDLNKDGVFNEAETDAVFQNAFTYTSDYNYFTFIRIGSRRNSPTYIDRKYFSASQENGTLVYQFFVDLSAYKNEKEIYIACYDYTFFCDIQYPENNVRFLDVAGKKLSYTIVENKDFPVYYDPFGSYDDTRVYYKWAPGLNTYYPKQIYVRYTD